MITIKVIPHEDQRYPTVGDWIVRRNSDIEIYVSDMKNWKYELLVAFHELIEVVLCKDRGITQKEVDAFDKQYEKRRAQGLLHPNDPIEPGDHHAAPYRKEHFLATTLERLLAAALFVDWQDYDHTVDSL